MIYFFDLMQFRENKLKEPAPLTPNSSFPELVVYHLPKHEWFNVLKEPFLQLGSNVFNERYLFLLSEKQCCAVEELLTAWTKWHRLGLYQHGETQRRCLYYGALNWGLAWHM